MDNTKDTTGDPYDIFIVKDNKNGIDNYGDNNTKDHLGITALTAIMELATESQDFRANKQPLKGCFSNKIKVLLDSGSDGDFFFLPKGRVTWTSVYGQV